MASGNATVKLRPIKFAFLVPYNDKESLLEAVQINTFLWGGAYNPIIPIYEKIPRNFPQHLKEHIRDKDYLKKYLDTYNPDYIVRLGECRNQEFNKNNDENILAEDIFIGFETWRVPHYGIGLFEVLNHFAANEHKFLQRNEKKICVPKFSGKYSLFLSSIFGQFSDEIYEVFAKKYSSFFECSYPETSITNYTELLSQQNLSLRKLTTYQVNQRGNHPCLLYLDANKFIDIVDYWNLRALGFDVIPIAKQSINSEVLRNDVVNFINQNYEPRKYPATSNKATFYESSSINTFDFETEKFLRDLSIPIQCPIREGEIDKDKVHQSYLPLIGDWAFEMNSKSRIRFPLVKEAKFSIANDIGQIKLVSPEFMFPTIRKVAFANDIELTTYHDEKLMAEVIPEGNNLVALSIGGFDFPEWRVKKGNLTYLSHFDDWTLQLKLPIAEDVFFRWFQNSDFNVSISPAGRIAKQMLKTLGGIRGTWLLANEQIFDLIYQKFNYRNKRKSDGAEKNINHSKSVNYEDLLGNIKKISNQSNFHLFKNPKYVFSKLLDTQIIQLGVEVSCSFCNQPSWYSIDDIKYKIKCLNCLEEFILPTHSPKAELRWAYRTLGAFSPATTHYGSYSVLLSLRFFQMTLNGKTTPIFGLEIQNKKENRSKIPEADLALFFQEDFALNEKNDFVLVECKTYNNPFIEKDIETMRFLSQDFPEAFVVFATLEKALSEKEKTLIKKFIKELEVNNGKDKQNRFTARVIILTGLELYATSSAPYCWDGKYEKHLVPNLMGNKLIELSNFTQRIYLAK